jgi:outer membrane protein TolC
LPGVCRSATLLLIASALTRSAQAEVIRLEALEQQALARRAEPTNRASTRRARAAVSLARSATRPTFALNGEAAIAPGGALIRVRDVNGDEYRVPGSRPLGDADAFAPEPRYGATLSVAARLYDFGRSADKVAAAEASSRAVAAETTATADRVVRDVHQAYLEWLVAAGRARLARENLEAAHTRGLAVQGRVEEGSLPPASLLTSRAEEARSSLELVQARGGLTAARLALEATIGAPLPESAEPDASLLDAAPKATRSRQSASLVALQRRRDASLANARSLSRPSAPVLGGAAEAGVRGQNGLVLPVYKLGITLAVPLSDGGALSAQEELAKAEAAELAAEASELSRTLSNQEASARAAWANASERVTAAEQVRAAAEAVLRAAEDRNQLGTGSVESVIDARAETTRAALEVLLARAARTDAVLRLRELGSGTGPASSLSVRADAP